MIGNTGTIPSGIDVCGYAEELWLPAAVSGVTPVVLTPDVCVSECTEDPGSVEVIDVAADLDSVGLGAPEVLPTDAEALTEAVVFEKVEEPVPSLTVLLFTLSVSAVTTVEPGVMVLDVCRLGVVTVWVVLTIVETSTAEVLSDDVLPCVVSVDCAGVIVVLGCKLELTEDGTSVGMVVLSVEPSVDKAVVTGPVVPSTEGLGCELVTDVSPVEPMLDCLLVTVAPSVKYKFKCSE